jgi:hypothetical protein
VTMSCLLPTSSGFKMRSMISPRCSSSRRNAHWDAVACHFAPVLLSAVVSASIDGGRVLDTPVARSIRISRA